MNLSQISLKSIIVPILSIMMMIYFTYHIFKGDRGILSLLRIQKEITNLQTQLDSINTERHYLERNVSLLLPNNIDPDLLDQQIRSILHYAHSDEVIINTETSVGRRIQ